MVSEDGHELSWRVVNAKLFTQVRSLHFQLLIVLSAKDLLLVVEAS